MSMEWVCITEYAYMNWYQYWNQYQIFSFVLGIKGTVKNGISPLQQVPDSEIL